MYDDNTKSGVLAGVILVSLGILILLGVVGFFSAMRSIDTGTIGVVTQYGEVTGRELDAGLSFVAPFGINKVARYDIKTMKEEQNATAATNDL